MLSRYPRAATRLAIAVALAGVSLAPSSAHAQPGVAAKFGARDPKTCVDRTKPVRGVITPALAAAYVACSEESVSYTALWLVEKVAVQIGAGRPFQMRTDAYNDIDPSKPIYPIRGSYVRYSCAVPSSIPGFPSTVGKNCTLYDQPHATGACYRTTFNDWRCGMKDLDNTLKIISQGIPGPG